jgi:hypothetical protein
MSASLPTTIGEAPPAYESFVMLASMFPPGPVLVQDTRGTAFFGGPMWVNQSSCLCLYDQFEEFHWVLYENGDFCEFRDAVSGVRNNPAHEGTLDLEDLGLDLDDSHSGTLPVLGRGSPIRTLSINQATARFDSGSWLSEGGYMRRVHFAVVIFLPTGPVEIFARSFASQYFLAVACYRVWQKPFPNELFDEFSAAATRNGMPFDYHGGVTPGAVQPELNVLFDLFAKGNTRQQATIVAGLVNTPTSHLRPHRFKPVWLGHVLQFFKATSEPEEQRLALSLLVRFLEPCGMVRSAPGCQVVFVFLWFACFYAGQAGRHGESAIF